MLKSIGIAALTALLVGPVRAQTGNQVIAPDWDAIYAKRDAWTKHWNRTVER